jgi:hypothetical protein
VWDNPAAAKAFQAGAGAKLQARKRPGWRGLLEHLEIAGRPASRYVWAPERWEGWNRVPEVELVEGGR